MRIVRTAAGLVAATWIGLVVLASPVRAQSDPLPSWNDGPAKAAVIAFVTRVTKEGGADFVPVVERIATFDNDGTLWSEQPLYFQFIFAVERVKALAPQHPEWQTEEPFRSVLAGDMKTALAGGNEAILKLVTASHADMTSDEFDEVVADWLATSRHPALKNLGVAVSGITVTFGD